MARAKNTPNDPHRRDRIMDATVDLLLADGIRAVTARAVASTADLPVGSVSYYFPSVRDLLLEALGKVYRSRQESLSSWARTVTDSTVHRRLAELTHHQITEGRALTVLSYELEIQGLRDPDFALIGDSFTRTVEEHLRAHLSDDEARRLVATVDGLQLQSLFLSDPPTVDELYQVLWD